jgi:putative ABC transport system permease protein
MKFWRRREESLEDEVRDYINRETQLNMEAGMPADEARYAAQRKLGTTALVKEDTRAAWGWTWIERLWQDLRYGCRTMLKNPGFTLVALISLAIGIGANSAMFSLADGLILRPLPVDHPGEVVTVGYSSEVGHFGGIHASYRDYVDFRDKSKSFDGLVAYTISSFGFSAVAGAQSQMKSGMLVSGNFFRVLGVEPELGRTFRAEEDQAPGRDAVVILGHDFWEKELSADPAILGRRVLLSGIEFTVIGVAPARFTGMDQYFHPAFYVPAAMWPRFVSNPNDRPLEQRDSRQLTVKGRLKPGVTVAHAQAEMTVIGKALERTYPDTNRNRNLVVRTEFQTRIDQSPPDAVIAGMLLLLAGAVLAVACANVAGLLLSRAPVRAREISLRLAIGAGRGRLIRQLLTESFLIAIAGGLLGIGVGYVSTDFFSQLVPPNDQQAGISVQLDQRALLFSLAVSLVSAILCGLAPAIQTTRTDLVTSLRTAGADTPHRTRLLGRNALVAAQVALSMVLLMISTFVYRAFRMDLAAGPGFRTDHLLMMTLDPSLVRYNDAQTQQFYRQLSERASSTAGVRSATLVSGVPMDGNNLESFTILPEGYQFPIGQENVSVFGNTVDENFFEAVNIGILRGRGFRASDSASAPRVAVVNEVLAKHYWPDRDPIGKRMRLDKGRDGPWVEIVGVAKSTKYLWIAEGPTDFLYVPFAQRPRQQMTLLALSSGDPAGLAEPLRQVVRTLDSNLPVFGVKTFEEFYHFRAVSQPNLILQTVGAMGVMGLLLAMVGLYGLVAYAATQRRREIGIRMAIGAGRGTVLRMVLGQGLVLALSGIGIGLAVSVGVERLLNAMLESNGTDFVTYLLVAPALLGITALAVYIPAWRASRIDPMRVLRYE